MENIAMDTSEKRPLSPPSSFDHEAKVPKFSPQKVCMIYDFGTYYIYILDLNSRELNNTNTVGESIPLSPSLLLLESNMDHVAFCVVDSTLYMFVSAKKSVHFIDLSSSSDSYSAGSTLDISMLPRACDMKHTKARPSAISAPEGKILVFSNLITIADADAAARKENYNGTADEQVDFELFDPSANSWQQLPQLDFDCNRIRNRDFRGPHKAFQIMGVSFINKSTIFVQSYFGTFTLDMCFLEKGWVMEESFFGSMAPRILGSFPVIEDGICLNSFSSFHIKTGKGICCWFDYPTSSRDPKAVYRANKITILDGDNEECTFCTVRSLQDPEIYSEAIVTVYKCDLIKYRAEKREKGDCTPPSIEIVKEFKFVINPRSYICNPIYLYTIKADTDSICTSS